MRDVKYFFFDGYNEQVFVKMVLNKNCYFLEEGWNEDIDFEKEDVDFEEEEVDFEEDKESQELDNEESFQIIFFLLFYSIYK